jgi:hypothetical protein
LALSHEFRSGFDLMSACNNKPLIGGFNCWRP